MRHLYVKYQSSIPYSLKRGQRSKSRLQGQKSWHQMKGLSMGFLYVKYQSPTTNILKVGRKVKRPQV